MPEPSDGTGGFTGVTAGASAVMTAACTLAPSPAPSSTSTPLTCCNPSWADCWALSTMVVIRPLGANLVLGFTSPAATFVPATVPPAVVIVAWPLASTDTATSERLVSSAVPG